MVVSFEERMGHIPNLGSFLGDKKTRSQLSRKKIHAACSRTWDAQDVDRKKRRLVCARITLDLIHAP